MNADPSISRPNSPIPGAAAPKSTDTSSEQRGKAPARILVVDDDPDVLRVLGSALQLFNYRVDTAADGAVAWDALSAASYDLVITDHTMPRLTGLDLLRKLRAVRLDLPCILISGDLPSVEADLAALLWPGWAMEKPVRLDKLVSMVGALLAAHPIGSSNPRPGNARLTLCPA